jgi:DNA-binding NarL/FixJ family response regulator
MPVPAAALGLAVVAGTAAADVSTVGGCCAREPAAAGWLAHAPGGRAHLLKQPCSGVSACCGGAAAEVYAAGVEQPQALRAVIVDDSPTDRELTRTALADATWPVDIVGEATDGEAGIALVQQAQPDIVVLDLRMPVLDGFDALPRIRRAAPTAAVVVLSSLPEDEAGPVVRASGAVGFVGKSMSTQQLGFEILLAARLLDIALVRSTLPPDPRSASAARRLARDAFTEWELGDAWDSAELLISELVTNAVTHARSAADVAIRLLPDRVHVAITDDAGDLPTQLQQSPDDGESGRGLALVEALSARWGTFSADSRKTVWFELHRARVPGV